MLNETGSMASRRLWLLSPLLCMDQWQAPIQVRWWSGAGGVVHVAWCIWCGEEGGVGACGGVVKEV